MPGPMIYNGGWCAKCGDAPRASNHAYCRMCRNAYSAESRRKRYQADPEHRREVARKARFRRYGVTEERYTELWAQQGGVCAICLIATEGRELGVDHDHATGEIRGLLCENCNGAIGMLQERPDLMHRAAEYVV